MLGISKLHNSIRHYAWGSRTGIAEFLGRPSPAAEPEAELWMGAHPGAPSEVEIGGRRVSLAEVIAEHPREVLGAAADLHGATLPFLFKVLAAGQALSIQAHPNRRQAAAGCRREDELGIARDDALRNYRDANHKPEVLCAVTTFVVLRGFRPPAEILDLMRPLGLPDALPEVGSALRSGDLESFFGAYMSLERERFDAALARALVRIGDRHGTGTDTGTDTDTDNAFAWVEKLERQFPGDRGVLAPLFLHLLELSPGEAIFTGPGVLHSYLDGVGIELMANSDNVVRGGLTSKHADVQELLRILRFEPETPRLLSSITDRGVRRYQTVAGEFDLSVLEVEPEAPCQAPGGGACILLCTRGRGTIRSTGDAPLAFDRGDCLLVPAAAGSYLIAGSASLYRASVPVDL